MRGPPESDSWLPALVAFHRSGGAIPNQAELARHASAHEQMSVLEVLLAWH